MDYRVRYYNARWWVSYGERLLGGYSANDLRSYVFPLYTPQGMLVLQEAPPDHPHHQLWNAGSFGRARHSQRAVPAFDALQPQLSPSGVDFVHQVQWQTEEGTLLLSEERRITLRAHAECTQIVWRSTFSHPDKQTHLGQTKESGIGLRVPPHWESSFGGQIRNAHGNQGEAAVFDKLSPWLNIEGQTLGDGVAGVVFLPASPEASYPWFTRDYGCHVYNPARFGAVDLAPAQSLTWSVSVLAYDHHRTVAEVDELVGLYSSRP
jgi:hypothetical protein